MHPTRPLNVILAGVGGQGVYALTRVLATLCHDTRRQCCGSTFKGGAQTLGSIYSVLRIAPSSPSECAMYSAQIPEGDLDLLIGLEPWEALRYQRFFGTHTRVYVNVRVRSLLSTRYGHLGPQDPIEALRSFELSAVVAHDYTASAIDEFGTSKMANFLLGWDVVSAGHLPFGTDAFAAGFAACVRLDHEAAARVKKYPLASRDGPVAAR